MGISNNRIQAYVNDATYERLKSLSELRGLSISSVASSILQTVPLDGNSPSSSSPDDYVSMAQLESIFREFQSQMSALIIREIAIAETRWEASATAANVINQSIIQDLAPLIPLIPPSSKPSSRKKSSRV
jgi:hypothetical protein